MARVSEKIVTFLPWNEIEDGAQKQILNASRLPFLFKWVAVMPDCHFGKGATVGTVMATLGAIVPAAVGVDIGCGMIALQTSLHRDDLGDLRAIREAIERRIPMSAGKNNSRIASTAEPRIAELKRVEAATGGNYASFDSDWERAMGTLGGGNHFVEVCLDENGAVWLTLHSGSRGVGNRIGNHYIRLAQEICRKRGVELPDRDLAHLAEGTGEFDNYLRDLEWAQMFARLNREEMMDRLLAVIAAASGAEVTTEAGGATRNAGAEPVTAAASRAGTPAAVAASGRGGQMNPASGGGCGVQIGTRASVELARINCHHNFTQIERHFGRDVWVTRKGAIEARVGMRGMIPGSMGTRSYIVTGLGNRDAFESAPHGAGRRMSRTKARAAHNLRDLEAAMSGIEYRKSRVLIDEIPAAYKDINQVMAHASELVRIDHTLRQIVNCKGD